MLIKIIYFLKNNKIHPLSILECADKGNRPLFRLFPEIKSRFRHVFPAYDALLFCTTNDATSVPLVLAVRHVKQLPHIPAYKLRLARLFARNTFDNVFVLPTLLTFLFHQVRRVRRVRHVHRVHRVRQVEHM